MESPKKSSHPSLSGIQLKANIKGLGEGNGNPLKYYCLENSMDRRAWQATVPGVTKNQT